MIREKAFYRRTAAPIGPGGWRCPCCAPAPGAGKKKYMKISKRKLGKFLTDLIVEQLE